jgi:CubicO group peptidase (beta-lactamase class C family)
MSLTAIVATAIETGIFPGACYAASNGTRRVVGTSGRYTYCPESPLIRQDTIWDLASVSKVVGMTTAAMLAYDERLLHLDMPVAAVLPAFAQNGKGDITVRNLLIHDSGLIAFRPYHRTLTEPEAVWEAICAEPLNYPTGTRTVYSDLSMITLQKVVEKQMGQPLDVLLRERVWAKLGMPDTQYNPGIGNPRCAPTESVEPWRTTLRKLRQGYLRNAGYSEVRVDGPEHPDAAHWIQGEVHDPTATVIGGVAGHAGLFSTTADLERFAKMMLNEGEDLLRPETVRLFTKRHDERSTRGLGWDTKSPSGSSAGTKFGPRSYGHTGYTGTSMWIDPDSRTYAILLTNRVHPTSENTRIIGFRPGFHDAVWAELNG